MSDFKEYEEALEHFKEHPEDIEWVGKALFRVYYTKPYFLDDGTAGTEIFSRTFRLTGETKW